MPRQDRQPTGTVAKPASLSVDEAVARLAARNQAPGSGNSPSPSEPQPNAAAADPDVTNPEPGESDAGGSEGDVAEDAAADTGTEDEPEPQETDTDDQMFLVTVDGEEVEVPLSELVASYSRHGDYTKKTQALAEQRRAVEQQANDLKALHTEMSAERVEIKKQGERYDAALTGLQGILDQRKAEWAKVDWAELKENDPEQYRDLRVEYLAFQQEQRELAEEQRRREQEKQAEAQQAQKEAAKRFREAITKALPEWSDESVRTKDWGAMYKLARSLEFSDEEINATTDPRIFLLLHKAMKFDRLQTTKASATNPAPNRVAGREGSQPAPARVVPPSGARPVTRAGNSGANVREAMDKFRQTRSIDDAAGFLAQARRQASARR